MKNNNFGLKLEMKSPRNRELLDEVGRFVPLGALLALITPFAAEGVTDRPVFAVDTALRIHVKRNI